ncbi:MAG: glucuronoarabinoxylan endo-1,4-beta-xylanase [Ruminococcus sp.]|nr:glucuronoarabinoxylan endo-1,4-beta-xylanase [Ruminococcus sp.]
MKSIFKRGVSALIGCAFSLSVFTASMPELNIDFQASAASDCVINTSVEHQVIQGFGGINHPEWTGQDLTDDQRETAFGNGEGQLGLTVLRVFVNPDKNQWYRALPTAKYASDNGVTVFASPWEPPANLAESGGSNGKLHLPQSNYGAYAQHLNDFGNYMKNNGVDLYAISVQNEPDYASEWTYWSSDETTNFIANYGDQITSTRLMSPESFQYTPENASWILGGKDGGKKYYSKILNNSKAMANCDLFGTHFYGTTRDWMDFPALESCGKPIWMTEVYVPDSTSNANTWPQALDVATNIHNGLVIGNMSAYVWWYIRRSYGPMLEDGSISKRGDMMAQYSKFVRPGFVRVDATEKPDSNLLVSAYKKDNQVVVVAINNGTSDIVQEFSFANEKLSQVERYRSSGTEKVVHTGQMELTGDGFFATLPAQSVTTFVCSGSVEADANGYYFHDTFEGDTSGWTGHGASDVLLSGRNPYMDAEALLSQNRESAWNGAEKAISSSVFVPGNAYSFSVCASYLDGENETETFKLTLQYTGSDGETHFSNIASGTAKKGNYVQLANTNYIIPEGASNLVIYVETDSGTNNFYIDEAIGAVAGTEIEGPEGYVFVEGDVNADGIFNIADVVLIQKWLLCAKDATLTDWQAGDLVDDDKLDIFDLCLMKRKLAKQI